MSWWYVGLFWSMSHFVMHIHIYKGNWDWRDYHLGDLISSYPSSVTWFISYIYLSTVVKISLKYYIQTWINIKNINLWFCEWLCFMFTLCNISVARNKLKREWRFIFYFLGWFRPSYNLIFYVSNFRKLIFQNSPLPL